MVVKKPREVMRRHGGRIGDKPIPYTLYSPTNIDKDKIITNLQTTVAYWINECKRFEAMLKREKRVGHLNGHTNKLVELASKLVVFPVLSKEDMLWNERLNDAVDNKDLDALLDMNQIKVKSK